MAQQLSQINRDIEARSRELDALTADDSDLHAWKLATELRDTYAQLNKQLQAASNRLSQCSSDGGTVPSTLVR